tara:strand:- start:366 stop:863 length:498 start_codon:yes stop_codon:yes gene_type:complete
MLHAIAKITNTSGLKGEVKLRPLSRYTIDYIVTKDLHIGQIENNLSSLKFENKVGDGKKMKFKFQGIDSHREAENIVGKTIYIDSKKDDNINFIGENVIGFSVETESGKKAGTLKDVMWLPANDVYIILKDGKELLVPVLDEFIISLNMDVEKLIIADVDGLLDI